MTELPQVIQFASRQQLASRVADVVATTLERGIATGGRGTLAVSGGSTPADLHRELAQRELSWGQVDITLVDERWVPADHPRSNEAFVRETFQGAKAATIHGLYTGGPLPQEAKDLEAFPGARPMDVVVLGMGNDGHTASWFPWAEGLAAALESERMFCPLTAQKSEVTGDEVERLTMTLHAVRRARWVGLLITGQDKLDTLGRAMADGAVEEMPVRAILRARRDLWICHAP